VQSFPRSGEQLLVGDFLDERVVERKTGSPPAALVPKSSRDSSAGAGYRQDRSPPPAAAANSRPSTAAVCKAACARRPPIVRAQHGPQAVGAVSASAPCSTTARHFAQEGGLPSAFSRIARTSDGGARAVGRVLDQRPALDLAQGGSTISACIVGPCFQSGRCVATRGLACVDPVDELVR
jgi:hypothetical protein